MRKHLIVLLALMFALFLAACSGGDSETSTDSGEENTEETSEESSEGEASGNQEITVTAKSEIPSMDPSLITDSVGFQWAGETYEGLYRLDENGQLADGMAESSEVSEDGLTWTFKLRDAEWSNGDPVTAHDFVYAWRRAVDPEVGSEYGPYFLGGIIKNAQAISDGEAELEELGATAKDDKTLVVELEKPVPYFKSMTVFITFMPLNQDFVEEHGDKFATEAEYTLSNGPFHMTEWNHGEGWTVEKSDSYWDADTVQLETINAKVIKEVSTGVNLYESGEIDQTELNAEFVDQYRSNEAFNVAEKPYLYFFKFNQDNNEALANADVRKAISYAIDRQSLVDVILNDGSVPAEGYVPSNFVSMPDSDEDFRDAQGPLVEYNVEKAQEHWQKGLEALGKDSVEIELLGDDTGTSKDVLAYYKNQLEENLEGLTIKLMEVPFKERVRRDNSSEFEMEAATWGPDYVDPNTYLNMYLTGGQNNNMGYSSEEYDALIEQANGEYAQDPDKRFETFMEAEKLLLEEDMAVAPIYQDAKAQLFRPSIKGVFTTSTGPEFEFKWAHVEE
ncbi:oligopeptide transport system substrate-binding protein [Halobacillus karajensis]|uniref:Dipeptide-binding protein DppE n=1 Tax=Halobacillus karajensis TaxID=195088 RepID=A0A059NVR8_9BACI|nr:peptide ABC transporter substrate-binding protein [Halobacillus karajensis]CDQ18424.1 Dipeptide-binding protein DppE precursor [Halobacillus karajensis]CDQ23504.1 Dipeptide-binding protein DppE precursor [Halobacillus karajensis]CDQ26986.1 Dipeptide-binding protein DppE precursor [Halobacillus karajensis]SEH51569.1 oligopeptide transport system substrate-binding protein [Halobacillus karajensis]